MKIENPSSVREGFNEFSAHLTSGENWLRLTLPFSFLIVRQLDGEILILVNISVSCRNQRTTPKG